MINCYRLAVIEMVVEMVSRLKLGPQFTLLLALVFLAGILLSGVTLWGTLQHEAEEDLTYSPP